MDERRSEERKAYLSEDARWGKAVFACLDKIAELAKEQPFTKETAETVKILAETATRLESATLNEETPN